MTEKPVTYMLSYEEPQEAAVKSRMRGQRRDRISWDYIHERRRLSNRKAAARSRTKRIEEKLRLEKELAELQKFHAAEMQRMATEMNLQNRIIEDLREQLRSRKQSYDAESATTTVPSTNITQSAANEFVVLDDVIVSPVASPASSFVEIFSKEDWDSFRPPCSPLDEFFTWL